MLISARFVNDEDNLLLHSARQEWNRSEPILRSAWQEFLRNCERVAQKCGLGGFPHEQLLQDSASESGQGHFPLEQFDLKLGNISQISYEGLKANDNF